MESINHGKTIWTILNHPIKFTRMLTLLASNNDYESVCDSYIKNVFRNEGVKDQTNTTNKFYLSVPEQLDVRALDGCALAYNYLSNFAITKTSYVDNVMLGGFDKKKGEKLVEVEYSTSKKYY
ncbi:Hypothetical protein ORPV_291 [Orpheovirus IHUMI-LCC2]|uniref:Uncharacterized protein n=1 Tax=Orpheovirus IHUMI-LCC2 TaxID=2023057 RepID=A0A2I2L3R1_9VIRU|nr:Hypothetical protein ORPV_291 [Orpheovirus IHUMI-LCC2]SNW62195.1 Hypothetical protein ORPV_291 [Orpheovirus IHUMI-LCC2]